MKLDLLELPPIDQQMKLTLINLLVANSKKLRVPPEVYEKFLSDIIEEITEKVQVLLEEFFEHWMSSQSEELNGIDNNETANSSEQKTLIMIQEFKKHWDETDPST